MMTDSQQNTDLATITRKREPSRKRSSASVSIPWPLYDRLDALAKAENASISSIIHGLADYYEETEAELDEITD